MPLTSNKQIVAAAVHDLLAPREFKKKGLVFSRTLSDVVHFIALQSSGSSTAEELQLTVNLGVLVPSLCEAWSPHDVWSSHWQQRLGFLLPMPSDRWWQIRSEREASVAAAEIVAGLLDYGLPKLDTLPTKAALAELWRTGQSPGLTEVQRKRSLDRIANEQTA